MNIVIAIILGYILRIFIERYVENKVPDLCKTCKYPKECKDNLGTCKHYVPNEEETK